MALLALGTAGVDSAGLVDMALDTAGAEPVG